MPIAYLTTAGLKVSMTSERLELTVPPETEESLPERRSIPFVDLEHVVVDAQVTLTTPALCALLERGIPVTLLSHGNRPSGIAMPLNRSTMIMQCQLERSKDGAFRLDQACRLVRAKVLNQRRVLQRLGANRKQSVCGIPWLNDVASRISDVSSLDALRGLEGAASGRYFQELAAFFPEDLPFERRTRRPPLNEVNALLSFLYTLLVSEISLHLRVSGLEPGWGYYHEPEDGRPSLALDLLEPFRAPIADALCLDMINHRRLQKKDFEVMEGAYLLKRNRRRKVFVALENRLEREFFHEQTGHRTTLRQMFKDLCRQAKASFAEGRSLEPFQMN